MTRLPRRAARRSLARALRPRSERGLLVELGRFGQTDDSLIFRPSGL